MPGPPPTPSKLVELKGNPSKKKVTTEPEPTRGAPRPPADLKGEALAEWGRIVPELDRLGLLTKVDRAYLVAYVESWASFNAAREALAEHGPLVAGRDGGLVKNPASQIMRDAADLMLKFGSRFGLSPSDRTRLSVPSGNEDGPDAQILSLLS
ncbi:phage terminase small subunit P27 family [Streptomyces sp. MBT56]|uniref:phage terminase small subunit P27 family n=1 Tax=unclassified Streptomyces TaxID=2593676 RepID=UPI00190D59BF|nr:MULTISPECIES: phage terminase small subunit P27 family [unclassified Streptomyces]MBK3559323.1 phage terminase small subunit P27 family [Streptomyces sp. MBT56]MBK3601046.1 phage terminase small subunit P27 family [Streptomyces sp. MBT54]MBK3613952.1 phage terminase small subunit P27 family [Streptomyces sp. MBT98]MBK6041983.1 phage terminase small subunit P27 family [Streptomyces sp. MBT55]